MLDWLSAPTGSVPAKTQHCVSDKSFDDEPPETPAHIFAVRAFKTALFGTPAPPPTVRVPRQQPAVGALPKVSVDATEDEKEEDGTVNVEDKRLENARRRDPFASPSKGILLTPGTGATRRKNVTFGALKLTKELDLPKPTNVTSTSTIDHPKPQQTKASDSTKEDLRRNLFQSKVRSVGSSSDSVETPSQTRQSYQTVKSAEVTEVLVEKDRNRSSLPSSDNTGDITVDLKSPRSRSGQHWKREYQRDHDKSKLEMRKLIRYGQAAKSYAIKRDQEAIRLGEKLKETEKQVMEMEDKVSGLATQMSNARLQDGNQARIMDDLAAQTAQALRYKQKADRYRLALRETQPPAQNTFDDDTFTMGEQNFQGTSMANAELQTLKSTAEKAQRKVAELEKKNVALKQTICKAKEEIKAHEERHQKWIERRKQKEERMITEKKELKERLRKSEEQQKLLLEKLEGSGNSERKGKHSRESGYSANDYNPAPRVRQSQPTSKRNSRLEVKASETDEGKISMPPPDLLPDKQQRRTLQKHDRTSSRKTSGPKEKPMNFMDRISSIGTARSPLQILKSSDAESFAGLEMPKEPRARDFVAQDSVLAPISYNNPSYSRTTSAETPRPVKELIVTSSPSSGGSARKILPADRIAAAKKRIQQRLAEKKKGEIRGKENVKLMA